MPNIPRHRVDLDSVRKRVAVWAEDLSARLQEARKDLLRCNGLRITASQYAGYLSVIEPGSPEICRALRLGAQSMAAVFSAATATSAEVEVTLGEGPPARVAAQVARDLHDVGSWREGYFLAAICRETPLLDVLCRTPIDLLRQSSTRAEEYSYLFADALRSYWRREDEAPERLLSALEATDPDRLQPASRDYVLHVVVPQMEMFYRLMLQEEDGFNEALLKALEHHNRFWSDATDSRNREASAFIALGPLALASFAHDAGLAVKVESDYLPGRLVDGDCKA